MNFDIVKRALSIAGFYIEICGLGRPALSCNTWEVGKDHSQRPSGGPAQFPPPAAALGISRPEAQSYRPPGRSPLPAAPGAEATAGYRAVSPLRETCIEEMGTRGPPGDSRHVESFCCNVELFRSTFAPNATKSLHTRFSPGRLRKSHRRRQNVALSIRVSHRPGLAGDVTHDLRLGKAPTVGILSRPSPSRTMQ